MLTIFKYTQTMILLIDFVCIMAVPLAGQNHHMTLFKLARSHDEMLRASTGVDGQKRDGCDNPLSGAPVTSGLYFAVQKMGT